MPGHESIKKILLINPSSIVKKLWIEDVQTFPLGLASIAAVLSSNNLEVEILDCLIGSYEHREEVDQDHVRIGMSDAEITEAVKKSAPDLVGIAVQFSIQLYPALKLAFLIKSIDSGIITVAGGNHACAAPQTISKASIDWLIMGEGEFRLLKLIEALNTKTTDFLGDDFVRLTADIPDGPGRIKVNYIEDLDQLPLPRYDLLALDRYWEKAGGSRYANMFITRGCPYDCVFCSIHTIMGTKIRKKSIPKVISEIIYLKDELGVQVIMIEDDNLTHDMEWAKDLFRGIIAQKLGLKFHLRNGVRADKLDLELLRLMRKAGVASLAISPESGSQKTIDTIINKHLRLEDCEKAIRMANRAGIYIFCFLVIGFPEETMADIQQTIRYAFRLKRLGSDTVWISCATPYPGTRLFENCIAKGIFSRDSVSYEDFATMGSVVHNQWFTPDELKKIRDDAMCRLTASPGRQLIMLALVNPFLFILKIRNVFLRRM